MRITVAEDGVPVGVFTLAEMRGANAGVSDVADALDRLEAGVVSVTLNLGAGGVTTLSVAPCPLPPPLCTECLEPVDTDEPHLSVDDYDFNDEVPW